MKRAERLKEKEVVMKQLLIPLVCLTLIGVAGCRQTEEEIVRGYSKDIQAWKAELKPPTAVADSGEQSLISVLFLENFRYDKERPLYVCLAIDGKVVFDGIPANMGPHSGQTIFPLLIEFDITKGKHVFTVFDVAHGMKVEKEIEIVKDWCWVVLDNRGRRFTHKPIMIWISDRVPRLS